MPRKDDAAVIREVTAVIDAAIAANRRSERVIVLVLIALFAVGLTLILWGAYLGKWQFLVPGGILQLTIAYPVKRLIKLREDNVRLQIILQMLRLAAPNQAEVLAAQLIERLIKQV
jgi:hypothetical protein